jgi:hypothetical protein
VLLLSLLISSGAMWRPNLLIAQAPLLSRGPYLQLGTPNSVVIRWRTGQPADSRVCYGANPANLFPCTDVVTTTTEHSVILSGLTPDTKYYYSIGTTAQVLAGGDSSHFFVTSPAPGESKPTRIWAIGDSGTADANARAVRDAYYAFTGTRYTDIWLMLGDNAYERGTDSEYQAAVFDMYPTMLRQTVLWPTLGNHDAYSADSGTQTGPYFNIFTVPSGGEAGGVPSGTEAYYSFDYGNIHFIVLDSYETSRSPSGPMMTWLRNDLASNTQPWVIAYWHHPPYSKGGNDSDVSNHLMKMREMVLPTLETGGVDLVLAAHSHSYERSFLIDGHYDTSNTFTEIMKKDGGDGRPDGTGAYQKPGGIETVPHGGTVYVVAGNAGEVTGGPLDHPAMFISLNVLGSIVLDVDGNRLNAQLLDSSGMVRDYFSIVKAVNFVPTVTITAWDPTATELGPTTGTFTVTRSGSTADELTVSYAMSGTATNGSDYASLTGNVTIQAGSSTALITVTPINDSFLEDSETAIATIATSGAYNIGALASATVTITETDPNKPPIINAGSDLILTLPANASLSGTVSDDGLPKPPAKVTTVWTKVSGSGTVVFGNPLSVDTTVSFSQSGTYVLRLAADDGALLVSDDLNVTVKPATKVDLTVASLSAPTKAAAGSTISVTDTTKNAGSGSAAVSTIKFYLSNNNTLDAGDVLLGGRAIPALAGGAKSSGTTSLTIPLGTPKGSRYLIGVADADGVVPEIQENNNSKIRSISVN